MVVAAEAFFDREPDEGPVDTKGTRLASLPGKKGRRDVVLERADELRREFIANCSHELKTPLTPIIGWADLFKRKREYSEEEVRAFAHTIAEQGRRLFNVVESLLKASSLNEEGSEGSLGWSTSEDVLQASARPLTEADIPVKIVVCAGAERVRGEHGYLTEIVHHLVDNAMKFGPEGSPVELTAHRAGDSVVIGVHDRGPGIEMADRDRVFDCFFQKDSSMTRAHGGLGLGLYIAHEMTEVLGGRIWVQDRPAGGASVRVRIPDHDPREAEGAEPLEDQSVELEIKEPARILVVDDDESVRVMVSTILDLEGYSVASAGSVQQAREELEEKAYDLVLCDVIMPGELALNLVRDLGSRDPDTCVIMMTGIDDPDFARSALDLGATGYLIKPFDPQDLVISVFEALHQRERMMKAEERVRTLQGTLEERNSALRRMVRRYQEASRQSLTDELTGLGNYRQFRKRLDEEIERAARYNHSLSIIIFDVDNFKLINDRFGHPRADAILAEIGARTTAHTRGRVDLLARHGGEEFAAILPETPKEAAGHVAERIRACVADTPFHTEFEDQPLEVTVSVGVASYPEDGVTADALFRSADWAMFQAKKGGRNTVSAAGDDPRSLVHRFFPDPEKVSEPG